MSGQKDQLIYVSLLRKENNMKIFLFDIDGTLLHSGGAGKEGMVAAFAEVFGIANGFDGIPMSGKTDPLILQQGLEKCGLQATSAQVAQFKSRYFEFLAQKIEQELPNKQVYPGVFKLLERLHTHPSVRVGLLTGNWRRGAEIKLRHFGIYHFFEFGAFGDDAVDRNELLPFALKRCQECLQKGITPGQVVVIGDTPSDIQCAQVHGAKVLAVATGKYSVSELHREGANWVVKNLADVEQILAWIL